MIDDEEQGLGESIYNTSSSVAQTASSINRKITEHKNSPRNNTSNTDKNTTAPPSDKTKHKNNEPNKTDKKVNQNNAIKEPSSGTAKETLKDAATEGSKDIAKEGVKEGVKQGATAAARTAGASATAGVSEIAYQAADKITKLINMGTNSDSSYGLFYIAIGVTIAIVIFIYIAVATVSTIMPGQVTSLLGNQITATNEAKANNGKNIFDLLNIFSLTDEDCMGEYNATMPYKDSIEQNMKMCKKYVRKAYEYQIDEVLKKYCEDNDYDYDLSVDKTKNFNSIDSVANNYNYTYLISIAGQTVDNTMDKFSVNDYKQYFKNNYIQLLQSQEKENGEEKRKDALGNYYTIKYCVFEITGVPINTMYEIFKISPDGAHPIFDNATNSEILPYTIYFFKEWAEQAGIDIGTEVNPTEFANGYGDMSVNTEKLKELENIFGDLSAQQQQIVSYAMSAVGCKYDQAHRLEEGIYDCSSLCSRAYLTLGIQMGAKYPTSANMCKYLVQNGCEISTTYSADNAQPGDLIFWRDTWKPADIASRYRRVTHVSIYVGNGKMVSAANSKSGVIYKEVNGLNKIVSVCRPLYLQ